MALLNKTTVRASALNRRSGLVCQASVRPASLIKQASGAVLSSVAAGILVASPAQAVGVDFAQAPKTASSPVHLDFKVDGMAVKPASEGLTPNTGHFHINIDEGPTPEGVAIPFDATHIHYGKGQTSADVEVPKGDHKLTLQFANANHESYGPEYAKTITVTVK
uniref:DUF4399 domain-containing protein n=1 Tax=Dunaliella tertiolecta TaxID=3047 RepID=A0A7S3QT74_DUNTE|mmetsp:Transcript_11768/g.32074  ORF Transcript_11768/g.32074 Transcript_11768/m.32074 type:complete len:164 (+) Transcript_11768:51-542(+)|eukprot:CAMPEP_0202347410 /NCGR_PEP_ID=MMETSP1126-20121109/5784_1 /ASSEMBLY_ACC=CAM_ASM_000457 /TAXON_ID=3047 /ORGANISM="Dunaliella tertiolecta, Strain CCMP1320" /LENGTH=163 /DNA_ID=CAMNT_0048938957 /DNA_START=32 /DNA_END=523 /DNA_ORIENTATION=+